MTMTQLDYESPARSPLTRVLEVREIPILLVLLLIAAATSFVQHSFLSEGNLRNILLWIPLLIIVAMGEMMVIITRGVDVSVGSIMGLAGMAVGVLFRDHWISNVYLGAALAVLIGGCLGAFNGLLIAICNVPPIVATLGTLGAIAGWSTSSAAGSRLTLMNFPRSLITGRCAGRLVKRSFPGL